jgi:hypothetical protein
VPIDPAALEANRAERVHVDGRELGEADVRALARPRCATHVGIACSGANLAGLSSREGQQSHEAEPEGRLHDETPDQLLRA